ncbi:MAG: TonB-dependent receptor [Pseudomonadales bacterium]|nr:TonB-dependent receptor [Pseudomonadales bacterium]
MRVRLLLPILISVISSGGVYAAKDGDRRMEEVVVTATKREESVQDIPIAVSAYEGEELERRGIQEFEGLMEVSPSIAIQQSTNSGQGGSIRIRGVGTAGSNPGLEAAVGTFIDGVYRSRAGQAFSDLGDIERIEILRGPQGTLFGKNTVAGAVNVVTNKPKFERNASISVSAGNFDAINVKGFVNADATDTLAFRVSFSKSERDGFIKSVNTEESFEDFDDRDRSSIKAQALWAPNDDFTARLILDYTDKDERCCVAVYTELESPLSEVSGLPTAAQLIGGNTDVFKKDSTPRAGTNFDPFTDIEDQGISLDLEWALSEDIIFKSITAYREFDMHRGVDPDFSTADVLSSLDTVNTFENFSQEFQFVGSTGPFDWLVGAYVYTEDMTSDEQIVFSTDGPAFLSLAFTGLASAEALAPNFSGNDAGRTGSPGHPINGGYNSDFVTDTEGWSIFTHNVWHATDRLAVTLGIRFSHEEKDGGGIVNGAAVGESIDDDFCATLSLSPALGASFCDNPSFKDNLEEDEFTGTIKVAYQLTDDLNLYGGISRGYKAGGFNLDQQAGEIDAITGRDTVLFDPEFSDSFELGLKGDYFDQRLRINTALFYTEFEDFQLNTFTGLGFTISNVPEVVSQGVEVESTFLLSDIATITFGATYADARYGDGTPIIVDKFGTDIQGERLNLSPLWSSSASLYVEDNLPGSAWVYSLNVNWSHVGSVNTGSDLKPEKFRGAYNKWNTQMALFSPSGKYSVVLWGRNLGNTIRRNVVANTPLQTSNYSTFLTIGRTYGLTVSAFLD